VHDSGRLDCWDVVELEPGVAEVVEQSGAVAEQERDDCELQLVEQPRRQVLQGDAGAARDQDVVAAGCVSRPVRARSRLPR
jgi:hypothetical protein